MAQRTCKVESCERTHQARGYCAAHYQAARRQNEFGQPLCAVDGCGRAIQAKRMCGMHRARVRAHGLPGTALPVKQPRGSRSLHKSTGYVRIGQRHEHRIVMECVLGRPLLPFESPHHVNGIRTDNRPENLELWVRPQPSGQRAVDLARWVIEHYRDLVIAELNKT